MPYIWRGSGPLRRSEAGEERRVNASGDGFVAVGEKFEPTESEVESFGDLMEHVEPEDSADNPEGSPDESGADDICGAEMTDGSVCERPAGDCPYHD